MSEEKKQEQAGDVTDETFEKAQAEGGETELSDVTAAEPAESDSAEPQADENAVEISELEAKLEENENRYLRLLADFDNFRRRSQIERESGEKYRSQQLITNLLPAIDNFERAMQIEPDNEQAKALLEGVGMVYRSIIDALKQEGAEQIEAVGNEFDPNLHQAVMQTEDDQFGSNIVVEEFQKGYKLKDRVIRPSMVKVNK